MQREKTSEEIRRSELIRELIKLDGLKTAEDAQNFVKEILGSTVQNMLVGELDDKLRYSKYDYRNKATANSRNDYSKKTLLSSAGNIELDSPRDRDGEFEPKLLGKTRPNLMTASKTG